MPAFVRTRAACERWAGLCRIAPAVGAPAFRHPPGTCEAHEGVEQPCAPRERIVQIAQMVAEKALQLLSLIRENREERFEDVVYPDNNPISLLLRCDPRDPSYSDNLRHIDQRFPGSRLSDNLAVRRALAEADVNTRRRKLQECIGRYPGGDAAPWSMCMVELNMMTSPPCWRAFFGKGAPDGDNEQWVEIDAQPDALKITYVTGADRAVTYDGRRDGCD